MGQERSKREPEDHPGEPSRSIRPSRMTSVRPARDAIAWSCVTMTTAVPSLLHAIEQLGDLFAGRAIELSGRLVGQQQHRPIGQRPRDGDPLHLAAGELRRAMVRAMGEADVLQKLGGARTPGFASRRGLRPAEARRSPRPSAWEAERIAERRNRSSPAACRCDRHRAASRHRDLRRAMRRSTACRRIRGCAAASISRSPKVPRWRRIRGIDPKRDAMHRGHGTAGIGNTLGDARVRLDTITRSPPLRNVDEIGSRATVRIG